MLSAIFMPPEKIVPEFSEISEQTKIAFDEGKFAMGECDLVVDNALIYAFNTQSDWFVDDSNLYWDYKNGGNIYSGYSMNITEKNRW